MTPEELYEALVERGLGHTADALVGLARPSVRLHTAPMGAAEAPPGASKLGGRPDLADGTAWPAKDGEPLAFIAQVDLAELPPVGGDAALPSAGVLSFFYDAEQRVWGFDPGDAGSWSVLYAPAGTRVTPRAFPAELPDHARYADRRLLPEVEMTFAPWELSEVEALGLSEQDRWTYGELVEADDLATIHRLLGHPDPIQGDMQLECQLASNGIDYGDEDPRTDVLRAGATGWRLLLQVDSDEDVGMMWGDVGRLYYWLRREDLAAGAWDAAWLILQCT